MENKLEEQMGSEGSGLLIHDLVFFKTSFLDLAMLAGCGLL